MRTGDLHAQPRRLGGVELVAVKARGSHTKRVRTRGEIYLLWKSETGQERTGGS